jgi:AraC-like DNA-binding protein
MVSILPQTLYEDSAMQKLFADGLSCGVYKKLSEPVIGKEGYLSAHAITMVLQGKLRIEDADGHLQEIQPGKMVLVQKGLYTVSDILPRSGCFEALMFFFEAELIQDFLESVGFDGAKGKSMPLTVLEVSEETRFFAESNLRLYGGQTPPNRRLAKMKLFELLHLIYAGVKEKDPFAALLASLGNKERKSLKEFMLANCHKPLAIEDYAYLTGRSVSTFTRDFKARFDGVSPKQWLIEQRLEKARDLLQTNVTQSVTEAAWESGYANVPHFIKNFHKRYGITPKQLLIEHRMKRMV